MGARDKPSYWAVLPADVRYDDQLKPNAKLLYAEISSLTNSSGYCWATNEYFAGLYGLAPATISRLVSQLEERGYIRCEMAATESGSERRIYAGIFSVRVQGGGIDKNVKTPLDEIVKRGVDENVKRGLDEIVKQNNKDINNIPPISPKGDVDLDMLFDRFWIAYPKKKAKAAARKAWDKLKPSMALCRTMSAALEKAKRSEEWTKDGGRYIPYPATWLNGRRWEDETETTQEGASPETRAPRYIRTEIVNGEERDIYA